MNTQSPKKLNIFTNKKGRYSFDNPAAVLDASDEIYSRDRNLDDHFVDDAYRTNVYVKRKYSESLKSLRLFRQSSKDGKIPVNNVGLFSYVFMSWMTPLILKLFKRRHKEIKEEDVWQCSDWESVASNTERLEVIWNKEVSSYGEKNASFLRVWLKFTKTRLLIQIFVFSLNAILTFLMTGFMTDLIVSYLESEESSTPYAVGLLMGNLVGQLLRASSFVFLFFFGGHTGIRFRAGVLGLAYKKLIRLKNVKGGTSSEIISIFGSDSQKFFMNCQMFGIIVAVPFYLIIGTVYTYYLIGPWCFIATGVFIFTYHLQALLTSWITRFRRKAMKWTDKRIRLLTEVLKSMKTIKMYGCEDVLQEAIKGARKKETNVLRMLSILTFISSGIIPVTPTLSSVATIAVYAAFGNELRASTAFSVVSTLNFMRVVVSIVPLATRVFGETRVSFERIKSLLLKEEYQAPSRNVSNKSNAIEIKQGIFAWGSDNVTSEKHHDMDNQIISDNEQQKSTSGRLETHDITVGKGELFGICGAVGSGKSSLISSIQGRMPILSGHLAVDGSIAYVSQQAWIFNGTLKENIVFGCTFDPVWYKKVIHACGLQPDLEHLPKGDETEIGDRGVNISGGQKQRVSLARAIYSKSDIYLLDDPLSAVDVHVGNHLFQECIKRLLKTKTVILVTHQLQYLEFCDKILVLGDGQIVEQGTHDYLLKKEGKYRTMIEQFRLTRTDLPTPEEHQPSLDQNTDSVKVSLCPGENGTKSDSSDHTPGKGKLIENEKIETGSVSFETYRSYVRAAGGICVSLVTFLLYVITIGSAVFSEWWLGIWLEETTDQSSITFDVHENETTPTSWINLSGSINTTPTTTETDMRREVYMIIYIGSVVAIIVSIVLKGFVSGIVFVGASRRLHNRALARVMKAPSSYYDANPIGRILNRFSRDTEEGDVYVPTFLDRLLQALLTVVMSIVSTAITLPWFLVALVPALIVFFVIKNISSVSIRQLKRLENTARSPLLNHVTSTGQGLSTIVSYNRQNVFITKCMKYADVTSVALFLYDGSLRWMDLRLELLGSLLAVSAAVVVVFTKHITPTAFAALGLSLCIKVISTIQYLARMMNELESRFTSIERLHEYERLEIETESSAVQTDVNWPSKGRITFSDVVMKYRHDMEPVLCNISFDILPKQKVGIVGRTGAGKSSLTAALFRLSNLTFGHIFIDGVDIELIPRSLLRSNISAIPQDPVLFAGTLRYNLDPFEKHSDFELWSALEQVHFKEKMQQFDMDLDLIIEENGENFSVGERQLICLARAILRRNKVLVLDEATASVDTATDTMIQDTIRDSFSDCTVLTIAHRLNTVLHCDVVFVMDSGRIIEIGAPGELIKDSSSHFYKMFQSQTANLQNVS